MRKIDLFSVKNAISWWNFEMLKVFCETSNKQFTFNTKTVDSEI